MLLTDLQQKIVGNPLNIVLSYLFIISDYCKYASMVYGVKF